MLKKIFIALVSLAIISASMSSCAVVAEPQEEESQTPTTTVTTTTTTTVPTTTVNKMDEISEKLAKLTKEDGPGEINLQMSTGKIADVMRKYDIPYTFGLDQADVIAANGAVYASNSFAGYGTFKIMQSYSGLKIGDSKETVISIYGQPDEIRDSLIDREVYVYAHGTVTDEFYSSQIEFTVQMKNDVVKEMFVAVDFPFEQVYGER